MSAEGTLSWGGEKFTITDDFLLLSAILFKDIKRSILGSPNVQFPRLLGAFGGSDDSGTRPRSHNSGWARPRWRRFLAQNVSPPGHCHPATAGVDPARPAGGLALVVSGCLPHGLQDFYLRAQWYCKFICPQMRHSFIYSSFKPPVCVSPSPGVCSEG